MATCQSCGGVIGRDCFECAWITQQQANQCEAAQYAEEAHHSLQQLKAEIAALEKKLFTINGADMCERNNIISICAEMRQLSAV